MQIKALIRAGPNFGNAVETVSAATALEFATPGKSQCIQKRPINQQIQDRHGDSAQDQCPHDVSLKDFSLPPPRRPFRSSRRK